jgi:hypothetical protein
MSWLIGVLTVASTIFGVLLGQVGAGFESLGVILAGIQSAREGRRVTLAEVLEGSDQALWAPS